MNFWAFWALSRIGLKQLLFKLEPYNLMDKVFFEPIQGWKSVRFETKFFELNNHILGLPSPIYRFKSLPFIFKVLCCVVRVNNKCRRHKKKFFIIKYKV